MLYNVIFTVDTPEWNDLPQVYAPPGYEDQEVWRQTEDSDSYEIPEEWKHDPAWETGHHRKWVGELTEEQLTEMIAACALSYEGEGSTLDNDGFSKSIVMSGQDDDEAQVSAYISPRSTDTELAEWLREHRERVPVALTDDPRQKYLFRPDRRDPWDAFAVAFLAMVR